jgi:hypothetical protein
MKNLEQIRVRSKIDVRLHSVALYNCRVEPLVVIGVAGSEYIQDVVILEICLSSVYINLNETHCNLHMDTTVSRSTWIVDTTVSGE